MAVTAEQVQLSIARESTLGTAPAVAFDVTSIVSESLAPNPTFTESAMIVAGSRGVPDNVLTELATGGDVARELVYENSTDLIMESLLGNTFGNDPIGNTTGADDVYDYTLVPGLTAEKRMMTSPTPTYDYQLYTGLVGASGSFSFAPGQTVTANATFVGMNITSPATGVAGGYTPPAGNPPMTAPKVTSMNICDVGTKTPVTWMSTACFSQLSIDLENNTRARMCIGKETANSIAMGRLNASGSGDLYYNSEVPITSLLDETEYALQVIASDLNANSYEFYFPRVKFTAAATPVTGLSTDVMTNFTLTALRDAAVGYTVIISR